MGLSGTDKNLALLIKDGDEEAFKELYLSFYKAVLFFITQYVPNSGAAEDLAQESFFYLWENRDRLEPSRGCRSYLLSIARSKALNYLRETRYNRKWIDSVEMQYRSEELLEKICNKDLLIRINDVIEKLPDKQREVLILSRKKYFSNKEIAQKLQVSIKTVEYRIMTALRQVRQNLGSF